MDQLKNRLELPLDARIEHIRRGVAVIERGGAPALILHGRAVLADTVELLADLVERLQLLENAVDLLAEGNDHAA